MKNILKTTGLLVVVSLIAKVLGFSKELVLASSYGSSAYTDAYLVSINIPSVLFTIIGSTITTTYIPLYFELKNNKGINEAEKFTNNVFNFVTLISIILSIIGIIYTKAFVKIFAVGFTGQILEMTVSFTRVTMLGILFIALSNLSSSYLQINDNFIIPGIVNIPFNISIIISIILSIKYGPLVMTWGTLIGFIFQFMVQIPFIYKYGYRYKFTLNINDEYVKKMVYLSIPIFFSVGVTQLNVMIDKTLASTLVEGSISSLNYANKLNTFVIALFITSISSVIYPIISKLSSENNKEKFIEIIKTSINSIVLLILPISIGAIVLSESIVTILFKRGAFDETAVKMTSIALVCYSIGMVAFSLHSIVANAFYSLKDTKTPMINSIIDVSLNIIFNIVLAKLMGHAGLALATSLSSIIGIILLLKSLNKKFKKFPQDKIIITTVKSFIAAISMGIIVSFVNRWLYSLMEGNGLISEVLPLIISVITGVVVYGIIIIMLKVDEISLIMNIIKEKFNKKSIIDSKQNEFKNINLS